MRVPDELRESVCFICVRKSDSKGTQQYHVGGTGFFVSMLNEFNADLSHVYLVTARHCVERASTHGDLYLRLNLRHGNSTLVQVNTEWVFAENDAVDVAVLPFIPDPSIYQFTHVTESLFAIDETIQRESIGPGDDLVVIGLFTHRFGKQRNNPIVRSGIIAGMPDDPLIDQDDRPYFAYLVELRSIGGLSGSPVFVFLHPGRVQERKIKLESKVFLLGLIRGHWDYRKPADLVDFLGNELEYVNMGIGIVTPVQEISRILHGEKLTAMRKSSAEKKPNQP